MRPPDLVLYLGSRVVSAVGNLASVAVFARVLGPAEYGVYILIFAWAIIAYGFAAQWMKFAYFGGYRSATAGAYVATYARLVLAAVAITTLILLGIAPLAGWSIAFTVALAALFGAMAIYEAAVEVSRTRLQSGTVAAAMVCRAVFVLAGGWGALSLSPSAVALALAVAAGHLAAAVPCLVALRDLGRARPEREAALQMVRYGWPLIFSFGVLALGQTVDRLLIAWYAGNAVLGPYGVIADLMRQSFMVVGEAIALALITVAKQHADEGRHDESRVIMRQAFTACVAAATLGTAFFVVFGHPLANLVLGEAFAGPAYDIVTPLALAFGFMMLRSFYFGQVIYFTDATLLDLIASVTFVVVSVLLGVMLVPAHGAFGGALALLVAHAAACAVVAVRGRTLYRFPVDPGPLVGMTIVAMLFVAASRGVEWLLGATRMALAMDAALFGIAALVIAWRFGLLALIGTRSVRGTGAP
ncbi:MAG: oligosaccharide flippase family protein [Rhodoplanes sp.]|uniref:lipopolysaccharide biosynthesis protein n=1 Tax=Rhodoplanes sp. TaxID=1968906 RepID=UPI00184F90E4|nr:oligosaccharide flippase family protein [Rhodoplanes sp.]NVO15333.1 oligosaccharide flippase family protein [Rhodoplanes sp.]